MRNTVKETPLQAKNNQSVYNNNINYCEIQVSLSYLFNLLRYNRIFVRTCSHNLLIMEIKEILLK